jgi:hypothetical protein
VDATERTVRPYRKKGGGVWLREVNCYINGKMVGTRGYDNHDRLLIETPMRNGKWHGVRLMWDEDGALDSAEPF